MQIKLRAWEHDYFTSAQITAQAGEVINMPFGDVVLKDGWNANDQLPYFEASSGEPLVDDNDIFSADDGVQPAIRGKKNGVDTEPVAFNPGGSLEVEPASVTDFRRILKLQEFAERLQIGGKRAVEFLRSMFGVKPQDSRFQRPEFITGVKSPVNISEVLNTTGTEEAPQGQMAGHAISAAFGKNGSFYVPEHGYIMAISSVRPKPAYMQGIAKHFLKTSDPFEYYFEQFAHIGEQAVNNIELYAYDQDQADVFGYQSRYAEYKYMAPRVAGDMRTTLDHWHSARKFESAPRLNQTFIECDPTRRIFAVTAEEEQTLICHMFHKIRAVRGMPKFGTPHI